MSLFLLLYLPIQLEDERAERAALKLVNKRCTEATAEAEKEKAVIPLSLKQLAQRNKTEFVFKDPKASFSNLI